MGLRTEPLVIFGRNVSTEHSDVTDLCSATVYSFRIYRGAELQRDLVPCVNKTNREKNEVGFYDRVEGVFLGNSGKGGLQIGR